MQMSEITLFHIRKGVIFHKKEVKILSKIIKNTLQITPVYFIIINCITIYSLFYYNKGKRKIFMAYRDTENKKFHSGNSRPGDRNERNVRNDRNDKNDRKSFSDDAQPRTDLIIGRNAVREALKAGRPADSLLVQRGERTGAILPIIAECKEKGIIVKEVDEKKLDFMCAHGNHQGIIMVAAAHEYSTVEAILKSAEEKNEAPFIVICDSLEDPHNLGAIIRTAECCGVHGIIIPERRSVSLSGIVGKTSAGALEYMPVARVTNLTNTIKDLKQRGIWVYAADMDGTPYREADLTGPVAIVVGGEGAGVSRLVKANCDGILSIPMKGHINSLNASVAAAVLMFEASAKR